LPSDERACIFASPLSCHAKSITHLRLLLDTASQCTVTPGHVFLQMHILVEVSLTELQTLPYIPPKHISVLPLLSDSLPQFLNLLSTLTIWYQDQRLMEPYPQHYTRRPKADEGAADAPLRLVLEHLDEL
jgi:hypothetical protein